MEELTEVITATEFHPTHCNLFMYSSSKSNIKLADMRDSALCDRHTKCEFTQRCERRFYISMFLSLRLRGGGGSIISVILLGDHLIYFRCQIQP